jgi:hypothetical protein
VEVTEAVAQDELNGTRMLVEDEIEGPDIDRRTRQMQSFTTKPLTFLQEWLALRRKGQDFTHTPMGYVCQGRSLIENHHFFRRAMKRNAVNTRAVSARDNQRQRSISTDSGDEDFSFDDELFGDDAYSDGGDDEPDMFDEISEDIEQDKEE